MLKVTHIVIPTDDSKGRSFILENEKGKRYDRPIEKYGFLWKVGTQFFDNEGHEAKKIYLLLQ